MGFDKLLFMKSTTIISVKRDGKVAMAGDGQVTLGEIAIKHGAKKIRTLYEGKVLVGFAGAVSDALSLLQRLEGKLEEYSGNLFRAAVELAKLWRTDKVLRLLQAQIIATDGDVLLLISGTGDLLEPDDGILAIGSGAPYALAAARALMRETSLSAEEIAKKSLKIASEICIYTNDKIEIRTLEKR